MEKGTTRSRLIYRGLSVFALLIILGLAGCPTGHRPPPSEPPPGGGYEPPPPPPPQASPRFRRASFRGKAFCPKDSFFDPRKGGQCWTCQGAARTAHRVTGKRACLIRARTRTAPAIQGRKAKLAWQCKGSWFWDAWRGGNCWRCPNGFKRAVSHIRSKKACTRQVRRRFRRAQFISNIGCDRGEFFDPRKGGQCWRCPRGYQRTARPVTAGRACRRRG
jgi:hypothetical protein